MKSFFFFALLLFSPVVFGAEEKAPASDAPAPPVDAAKPAPTPVGPPPHILTNMPLPHPNVVTSCHFPPVNKDEKFHPGDIIDALVGVSNEADGPITITHVAGAVTSPFDFSMYFQNFTEFDYNITVPAGEEWTVNYKFQPDPRIEPRALGMVLAVFYFDAAGKNFSTVAYNKTFEFSDFPDKIDAKTFFTYLGILAVVILVVVFGYKPAKEMIAAQTKKAPRKRVEVGDSKNEDDAWLVGTAAAEHRRRQSRGSSKSASPVRPPRVEPAHAE